MYADGSDTEDEDGDVIPTRSAAPKSMQSLRARAMWRQQGIEMLKRIANEYGIDIIIKPDPLLASPSHVAATGASKSSDTSTGAAPAGPRRVIIRSAGAAAAVATDAGTSNHVVSDESVGAGGAAGSPASAAPVRRWVGSRLSARVTGSATDTSTGGDCGTDIGPAAPTGAHLDAAEVLPSPGPTSAVRRVTAKRARMDSGDAAGIGSTGADSGNKRKAPNRLLSQALSAIGGAAANGSRAASNSKRRAVSAAADSTNVEPVSDSKSPQEDEHTAPPDLSSIAEPAPAAVIDVQHPPPAQSRAVAPARTLTLTVARTAAAVTPPVAARTAIRVIKPASSAAVRAVSAPAMAGTNSAHVGAPKPLLVSPPASTRAASTGAANSATGARKAAPKAKGVFSLLGAALAGLKKQTQGAT